MPDIELTNEEAEGRLPRACMCCGAPATVEVWRNLMLRSPVIGGPRLQSSEMLALRTVIAMAGVPRMRLRTSFCRDHRYYWHLRFGLLFGGLAGLFVLIVIGIAVVVVTIDKQKPNSHWVDGLLLLAVVVYLIAWVVPTAMLFRNTIRVKATDKDTVILQNVGAQYVAAVQGRRQPSA